MKTEKSCNNCNHHFSNHQRCDAIPCFGGDKWQPLPEQESKSAEEYLKDYFKRKGIDDINTLRSSERRFIHYAIEAMNEYAQSH